MSQRRPLIAGNWKMYKTVAEAERFIQAALPKIGAVGGVDIALCIPYTTLGPVVDSTRGSSIKVFAQNMHEQDEGAFTGEISPAMLCELEVAGVVLGHSERRQYFAESDEALAAKVLKALQSDLVPILCVGESESERADGLMEAKLKQQIEQGLALVSDEQLAEVVVAYEPIWAIGTGQVATPEQAGEATAYIRQLLGSRSETAAERVRILYGGSVKPDNTAELLAQPDIDGALVGGASLEVDSFAEIIKQAQQ